MQIPSILINPHYQDRYFDVVNALDEARQIYCKNTKLIETLKAQGKVAIGETGFGAGRVLLTLLDYLESEHQTLEQTSVWQIDYTSVELHPPPVSQLADILKLFETAEPSQLNHWVEQVIALYQHFDLNQKSCWQSHNLQTSFGEIRISLWFGEALEMLDAFEQLADPMRDVWFLEGHGPKANPEIWRRNVIQRVGQYTHEGGHCASFTVSAELRRELRAAGFQTDRLPGMGGKKQVLLGTKRADITNTSKPLNVMSQSSDKWKHIFESLSAKLKQDLSDLPGLLAIEHIGATSLEDVASEAIVDLDLVLSSGLHLTSCIQRLKACGYRQLKIQGFEEVPVFTAPGDAEHQIFVLPVSSLVLQQHLLLRDYLRQYPLKAAAYSQLKLDCAQRYPQDRRAYSGAKHQLIQKFLAEAGSI